MDYYGDPGEPAPRLPPSPAEWEALKAERDRLLLQIREVRKEEREHCIRLIEAPIRALQALMAQGDDGGLIGAHIQALEETARSVRESGEFRDAAEIKKQAEKEKCAADSHDWKSIPITVEGWDAECRKCGDRKET